MSVAAGSVGVTVAFSKLDERSIQVPEEMLRGLGFNSVTVRFTPNPA
ncbi:MAG: hypothetical protein M3Y04_01680 [Actinomycetota bacterium]|nr:hypothetical protein [Actinomycetota bacterium]